MNVFELPEGIDFEKPNTITKDRIQEYFDNIHSHFGEFCGDCQFMIDEKCNKGHRPRKYTLAIGPYEHLHARKNCEDFKLYTEDIDNEGIEKRVSNALDCFIQQYC